MFFFEKHDGFSVIETLISVIILLVIVVVGIPTYKDFKYSHLLELEAREISNLLRRAEFKSINGEESQSWGVGFKKDRYVLIRKDFEDEIQEFEDYFIGDQFEIVSDGDQGFLGDQVLFRRISGLPISNGKIIIKRKGRDSSYFVIRVNSEGLISISESQ